MTALTKLKSWLLGTLLLHVLALILISGPVLAGNLEDIARKFQDPTSFYLLGERLAKGRGVAQDLDQAINWYKKAAKLGHLRSQSRLGKMYYYGEGVKPDSQQAIKWLSKPAQDGDSTAQYLLGMTYLKAQDIKHDINKAIHFFKLAAADRHAEAAYQLARIYYDGTDVEKDINKAKDYLSLDQVAHMEEAQQLLAKIQGDTLAYKAKKQSAKNQSKEKKTHFRAQRAKLPPVVASLPATSQPQNKQASAKDKMLARAQSGNASAQYALGLAYLHGRNYFNRDREKARHWLEKAAQQQFTSAQFELGMMDYDSASKAGSDDNKWLRLAAEQGHAEAQYYLGSLYSGQRQYLLAKKWLAAAIAQGNDEALDLAVELYLDGKLKTLSHNTKLSWLKLAANKGLNEAQYQLAELYLQEPKQRNIVKARAWLEKAAAKGHLLAQYKIGQLFLNGEVNDKRYSLSAMWMRKAAEQGYKDAQFQLAELYRKGLGLPKSKTKAAKWYKLAAEQGHRQAKLILGRRQLY